MPRPSSSRPSSTARKKAPPGPSPLWGKTPAQEIAAQFDLLRAVADDPASLRATATELARHSGNLEVTQAAIVALGSMEDAGNREVLHEVYARGDDRTDAGGFIRAAVVRALQPILSEADRPLLMTALATYQRQGMYEISRVRQKPASLPDSGWNVTRF